MVVHLRTRGPFRREKKMNGEQDNCHWSLGKVGLELRGSILYPCRGQRVEAAILAEGKEKL